MEPLRPQESPIVITDIKMRFSSMVIFMVKWAFASIPAIIIICFILWIVFAMGYGLLTHKSGSQSVSSASSVAARMRVQADIPAIKTQLQLYESMNGRYPTTEQGLQALVTQPDTDPRPSRWYQLFRELPKDPWGNDYKYRCPGLKNPSGYDLFSAGPDGQADTTDDDWGG